MRCGGGTSQRKQIQLSDGNLPRAKNMPPACFFNALSSPASREQKNKRDIRKDVSFIWCARRDLKCRTNGNSGGKCSIECYIFYEWSIYCANNV